MLHRNLSLCKRCEAKYILKEFYKLIPPEEQDYFTNFVTNETHFHGMSLDDLVLKVMKNNRSKFVNSFYCWYYNVVDARKE